MLNLVIKTIETYVFQMHYIYMHIYHCMLDFHMGINCAKIFIDSEWNDYGFPTVLGNFQMPIQFSTWFSQWKPIGTFTCEIWSWKLVLIYNRTCSLIELTLGSQSPYAKLRFLKHQPPVMEVEVLFMIRVRGPLIKLFYLQVCYFLLFVLLLFLSWWCCYSCVDILLQVFLFNVFLL